ncbi:MAG: RDD family protein [Candidatus Stygibacter australis]|nr:RDD family protein [Candidatus Stygibacter australis]MDP8322207.1 RDD family protein [Candidatus Stygibacter australis]
MKDEDIHYEKCPACGSSISANESICPNCGLTLSVEALPEESEETKTCPVCGREYPETVINCDCGYNFVKHRDNIDVSPVWRRFANFVIDISFCAVLNRLIFINLTSTIFENLLSFLSSISSLLIVIINFIIFGLLIPFIYYVLSESLFQKTLGKLFSRTKVIMINGSKPNLLTIVIRTLIRFVPFEYLSFGFGIWWHDQWTKTRVVKG